MTDTLIVFVSCENREQAEKIAGQVVTDRLAACVNVLPGVRSCYVWEGQLTWSEETLILLKTTSNRYSILEARILELHSYAVPEIVAVPVEAGSRAYLKWVEDSVAR